MIAGFLLILVAHSMVALRRTAGAFRNGDLCVAADMNGTHSNGPGKDSSAGFLFNVVEDPTVSSSIVWIFATHNTTRLLFNRTDATFAWLAIMLGG